AWLALGRGGGGAEQPVMHLAMPAPAAAVFAVSGSYPGLPVVSPTGRHIVFSAKSGEGSVQLFVRAMDSGRAVALDGTANAQYPFWSPDGQWIAFFDRTEGLKKVPVGGGPTQTICAAGNGKGGTWNEAGQIVFAPEYNASLQVVAAVGGQPRTATAVEQDEGFDSHRHPQFLPDGHHFLYMARGVGGRDSELRLGNLDGGPPRMIMKLANMAQYASGHLLFLNQQTLMAQPFDATSGTLSGTAVPVAEDVMIMAGAAKGAFAASDEGTLIYLRGKAETDASLSWLDRKGNDLGAVGDRGAYDSVVLSPDGRRAVLTVSDRTAGTNDLWVMEIERNFRTRLTNHPADEAYPVWQPDGRAVFFVSDRTGKFSVYRREIGGTGEAELVLEAPTAILLWACSPDGRTLLYSIGGENTGLDLWAADLTGQAEPRLLRRSPEDDGAARFSPDGRWISYWSDESGSGQTYLAPWPQLTPVSQVSTTTGTWSYWRSSGRELVFQEEGGRLQAAALTFTGDEVRIGVPVTLFDHAPVQLEGPWLDMTGDGERFLAISSVASDPPAFCDVVIGWPRRLLR
ncbi:MAG: PD40 domain-containing protein, partial [Krumholzibacteria bacterium]|nr:PD40 domain-containing protein [Candidatus Krumholzibacteria bacterium]